MDVVGIETQARISTSQQQQEERFDRFQQDQADD